MGITSSMRTLMRAARGNGAIPIRPEDGWKLVALEGQIAAMRRESQRLQQAIQQAAAQKHAHWAAMARRYGFDPDGNYSLDDAATTLTRVQASSASPAPVDEKGP